MTKYVGTYSLEDLLAQRFVPATEFGLDRIAAAIQARLEWLNGQVTSQMGLLAETTSDVRRIWGVMSIWKWSKLTSWAWLALRSRATA